MPDYTKVNLREVEDMAPKFGMAPGLESRFARRALGLEKQGISYFRFEPDFRMPFGHSHEEQEEIYLVISGSARMRIEDELVELGPWDAVRLPPEVIRGIEAGAEGAEVIVVGAPHTETPDVQMKRGWWED